MLSPQIYKIDPLTAPTNIHIYTGSVFSLEIFGQRLFMSLLTLPLTYLYRHKNQSIIVYTTSSVIATWVRKGTSGILKGT